MEKPLYESHPAMFRNNPVGYILSVVLIFAFGLGLLILLIWWLKTLGTTLTVTSEKVSLRKGLLSKNTNDVYISDVRSVQVKQGIFQRLFKVGTVAIASAGTAGIEIVATGMPEPEKVKEIVDTYRHKNS